MEWLSIADTDLLVAQQSMNLEPDVKYRMVGFHAQQCAEKYLKGYLVYHDVDFPYTHNISSLLELCAKHGD
jgi:HEPN domain-containing protein